MAYQRSFKDDLAHSRKFVAAWDAYWKSVYPDKEIIRDLPIEVDRTLGVDVLLRDGKNNKMMIDEKVTDDRWPDYPVEIVSNLQTRRVGWAYSSQGIYVAIAKHRQGEYTFSAPPVLFYLDDLFIKRICRHPIFEVRQLHTDGLYGTLIKRVPKEYLLNFRDEMWWKEKEGSQNKLWMY